jgi:phage head maturation protease
VQKDARGLRFELMAPATSWGRDAVESIRRGDVSGVSFAFSVRKEGGDTWARGGGDGVAERTLLDADLYEVSPVTFPAYPATSVGVRAVSVPDFEESDSRAAGEMIDAQNDGRAAVALAYRQQLEILRRK